MKIAQVACVYPPYKGGIGNVARTYAYLSGLAGHESIVLTPDYGLRKDFERDSNEKIVRLKPLLKYGNGAFLPQLFFLARNYDIVHLHYPFFGGAEMIWLSKLYDRKGFKLIIHYHMDVNLRGNLVKFLSIPSRMIIGSLLKKADAITFASQDYIDHCGVKDVIAKYHKKSFEIPFAVDIDKFHPASSRPVNDYCRLLFVSNLDRAHYFKGLDILLEALSAISGEKWFLTIVGDGDLRSEYEDKSRKLNLDKKIFFTGKVPDNRLAEYYRQSEIFILPSINGNEAFGLVILEALASGVAVVASGLPGVQSVFKENMQGLITAPGDREDIKRKLILLINDRKLRERMGIAARALAVKEYSLDILQKRLLSVYEKINSAK